MYKIPFFFLFNLLRNKFKLYELKELTNARWFDPQYFQKYSAAPFENDIVFLHYKFNFLFKARMQFVKCIYT